jgi:SAM-dependent methyltransferase
VSYDDIAEGYARYWGPTIRPAALHALELIEPAVAAAQRTSDQVTMLDVGTGTGTLAIEALRRWPTLQVVGIDPSGGMLDIARRDAEEHLPGPIVARYRTEVAPADAIPLEDASIDLAVSSFVLQLVASRAAAFREIRRVLAPGATFAWVSWLDTDRPYEPDRVANEVLDEFGFDPPEPGDRGGDFASVASAANGMRRAGFTEVRATERELVHPWSPEDYLDFYAKFDEQSLFDDLEPDERAEIETKILAGVRALTPAERTLRLPIVAVVGRVADA